MSNIPMTRPEEAIAVHKDPKFRTSSFVELQEGRILQTNGRTFSTSDDGGITWSEDIQSTDENDGIVTADQLVNLSDGAIGAAGRWMEPSAPRFSVHAKRSSHYRFWRSEDRGETWKSPVRIQPPGIVMHAYQHVLIRTSSGRLVLPLYSSIGQGTWHQEGAPFVGGYLNGNFVSSDAHFFDPHFSSCYVVYSDDEGLTWQTNRDGELLIILEPGGPRHYANEPAVEEISPGKLMMIMRTGLGRMFQAWSDDDGTSWSRPEPTQLAGTNAPGQVRKLPRTGHLIAVWTQQSEREIKQGYIRTRLSSAVSRNEGGVWEKFQNVESLHEETHVEAGPIRLVRPEGRYPMAQSAAAEIDADQTVHFESYGRWSYPSVLALEDRVLISHSYSTHDKATGESNSQGAMLKVLPISWFYGGQDPDNAENSVLTKISELPPRP